MSSSATASSQQLASAPLAPRVVIWPRIPLVYAFLHGLWFALYAFLGKGFAYAGWPPFYVSEFLLGLALIALLATRKLGSLILTPLGGILSCFVLWQVACMAPYLETFGFDALRDSVIWGYSLFGLTTAALIVRLPRSLEISLQRYGRFARLYLFLGPATWLATLYLHDWLPTWPGTNTSVPLIKGDEYGVHLAGVFAFSLLGLRRSRPWWALVIMFDILLGMSVRSGLLAFLCAAAFVLFLRPRIGKIAILATASSILVLAMVVFDVRFTPPGAARELSAEVLSRSLVSLVSDSEHSDFEGTKEWRLKWWRTIGNYTFEGPYFWTGKGYGVNLAESDGFQVGTQEEPLRSPHNSHLTFLARSGVPGLVLWTLLQGTWATSILRSYLRARKLKLPNWSGLFAWLLTYWIAFMVAASFDVFLEGPMAGIPFWTIFGLGWGSHILFRSQLDGNSSSAAAAPPVLWRDRPAEYVVV
jgi:hypothetical protein